MEAKSPQIDQRNTRLGLDPGGGRLTAYLQMASTAKSPRMLLAPIADLIPDGL